MMWHRGRQYFEHAGGWRKEADKVGGGVLIHQAIHHIDLLRWLMGSVESVNGRLGSLVHDVDADVDVEDTGYALIKFKSGAFGVIEASNAATSSLSDILEIHGASGSVRLANNAFANRIVFWNTGNSAKRKMADFLRAKIMMIGNLRKGTFGDQVEDFCGAILNNRQPFVTGEEARKTLELVLAIYRSHRLKREVQVDI